MVTQDDIIRRTVPVEVWNECLAWAEKIRVGKSYSNSRQVLKSNQDSFGAVAEIYYAKWIEKSLIPGKWNGLKIHSGGDAGDIELAFGKWIDVKARKIKKPFAREEWELDSYVNIDHKNLKDTVGYYMFATWCEPIKQISLLGWLATDEINNRPSSRVVKAGETMFGSVVAQNDLTMIQVRDLNPLTSFYYDQQPKNAVDNWITV